VHRASLHAQHRVLAGEIERLRACRQAPSPRWSTAADARELTGWRQWVEDVAGRVPAGPRPGVVVQLLRALAELFLGLLLPPVTTDAMVASTRVTDALVAAGSGVLGLVTVRPSSDRIQHADPPPTAQTTRVPQIPAHLELRECC
jgi:hypothetical protein